jgi:Tol biopolymer transport system component
VEVADLNIKLFVTATALAAAIIPLAACGSGGGGGGEGPSPTATVTAEATAAPSPSPPAGGRLGADVTPPPITPGTGEGPEPEGVIVFVSWRDGNREIYSINVDGSDPKNLTNDPGIDENPDVSPDGKQVVWASDRGGERLHLWVMNIDGSNQRQLTFDSGGDNSPRWSPDGKKIAFARGTAIMVTDVEGGKPEVAFRGGNLATADPCQVGGFPGGWSPDGREITYYSADAARGTSNVCIVDLESSKVTVVPQTPGFHAEPTWSRDGRYLAYRSIRGGNNDVYTYDLKTNTERRLTDVPDLDIEPNWSPDGEWIVFASGRNSEGIRSAEVPVCCIDIYIMRKDGSDVRQVTTDPAKDSEPVWVP